MGVNVWDIDPAPTAYDGEVGDEMEEVVHYETEEILHSIPEDIYLEPEPDRFNQVKNEFLITEEDIIVIHGLKRIDMDREMTIESGFADLPYLLTERNLDLLFKFLLYFYIAFFSTPVFVLVVAFVVDFLINLVFFYVVVDFGDHWYDYVIGYIGSTAVFFLSVIFGVYLLLDSLLFLKDAWDFRRGFSAQLEGFEHRMILFVRCLPGYDFVIEKINEFYFSKVKDHAISIEKSPTLTIMRLWMRNLGQLFFMFVVFAAAFVWSGFIEKSWVTGYYSALVLVPLYISLVVFIVYVVTGYLLLVLKIIGLKKDVLQPNRGAPINHSFLYHFKKRPYVSALVAVCILTVFAYALLIIGFVCYIVSFYKFIPQMLFFVFFLAVTLPPAVHLYQLLALQILSRQMWRWIKAYAKGLVKNFKRLLVLVFVFVFLVFVLLTLVAHLFILETPEAATESVLKGTTLKYPICSARWEDLNIVDLSLFAKIAYCKGDWFDYYFEKWFTNNSDWFHIMTHEMGEHEFVTFSSFYSASRNMYIVATRGTVANVDWLQDLYMYSEIVTLQVLDVVFPFFTILPEERITDIVLLMNTLSKYIFPNSRTYTVTVEEYIASSFYTKQDIPASDKRLHSNGAGHLLMHVDDIRKVSPTATIIMTGHSLGGAVSQAVAGARENITAVTFASPGMLFSRKKYGIEHVGDLFRSVTNVRSNRDPIGLPDKGVGLIQWIDCDNVNMVSCHFMEHYVYELYAGCDLGTPPLPDNACLASDNWPFATNKTSNT